MFKLTDSADLEKAGKSIGSFFASQAADLVKSMEFYKGLGTSHEGGRVHNEALHQLHLERAAECKAVHASLPADHELKAHFLKAEAYHTAAAEHHKAIAADDESVSKAYLGYADAIKTQADALKATATEWGAAAKPNGSVSGLFSRAAGATPAVAPSGNIITDMVHETTVSLAKKSMELMDNDPEVKQFMRETILKMVGETIGSTMMPTNVSAVAPNRPGITAVPRAGQQPVPAEPNVPLEFRKLVAIEDEEQRPIF